MPGTLCPHKALQRRVAAGGSSSSLSLSFLPALMGGTSSHGVPRDGAVRCTSDSRRGGPRGGPRPSRAPHAARLTDARHEAR